MNIQWYPGHMTKAKRMMQEDIKLIDIVIELLDARVPISSRNPDIDTLAKNKFRLVLLNKCDLADEKITAKWESYFKEKGIIIIRIKDVGDFIQVEIEDNGKGIGIKELPYICGVAF